LVHLNMTVDDRKKVPAVFYKNISGNMPVREWLLSLSTDDKKSIGEDIKTVEYGWPVGMPTCRPLKDGLYEVRTNLSDRRIARVIFCFYKDGMVLLHGFIKKQQKTPKQDLDLSRNRKKEVENG